MILAFFWFLLGGSGFTWNIMKKYKNYYCTSKDKLVSNELFSVYFNKNFTVAKTKIEEDEDMYRFYESNNYRPHQTIQNTLTDKIYFISRKLMLYFKYKTIEPYVSSKSILDYGCGNGEFLNYVSKRGLNGVGVEKSNHSQKICKKKDLKVFPTIQGLTNKRFDIISLWHVLEHVSNPSKTISSLSTILSNRGHFVIAVPNIQSIDSQVFKSEWAALDVPRHIWHFTAQGLIGLFKKQGYVLIKKRPLILDAYYISLLSAKRKKLIFPWLVSILIGTISNLIAIFSGNFSSNIFIFRRS